MSRRVLALLGLVSVLSLSAADAAPAGTGLEALADGVNRAASGIATAANGAVTAANGVAVAAQQALAEATAPASATAAAATEAPAPAVAEAPAVVIENALARVVIEPSRGAIRAMELKGTHPITLRPFLGRSDQSGAGGPGDDGKPAIAVLAPFMRADTADNRRWGKNSHNFLAQDEREPAWGLTEKDLGKPWTVAEQAADRVVLAYANAGFAYRLSYTLDAAKPSLATALTVTNRGAAAVQLSPAVWALTGIHMDYAPNEVSGGYLTAVIHRGGTTGALSKESIPADKAPATTIAGPFDFVGVKSRFFAAWVTPGAVAVGGAAAPEAAPTAGPGGPTAIAAAPATGWTAHLYGTTTETHKDHQFWLSLAHAPVLLAPGATLDASWAISTSGLASKDLALLSDSERRIEKADWMYRFFYILSGALTWVLNHLAALTGSFGVAVILLTIAVKAALFKLTWKQHASMFKMQALAPKLKALQNQYGNDKQAMAQKQMELYRKEGVNPLGGCLPLFVQIPIFIALFNAFQYSADMRGGCFLWIPDLTLPDQVWGMPIAFLGGWILSLNPLPIVYIALTVVMSLTQPMPTGGDPQQEQMAKTMRWLPVIFGVIFYNFASGLVLYFTINAALSTIEVKFIRHQLQKKS